MFLHYLGHAGWLFEENGYRLLCDPWQSAQGGFYGAWFPFPANDHVQFPSVVDAIYISHSHEDHFDIGTLSRYAPNTRIIIANFCDPVLRDGLQSSGFTNVASLADGETVNLGCFSIQIFLDEDWGMYHDSALVLRSPTATVVNLNDCRPRLSHEWQLDSVDVLLGHCSGANWYPAAYEYSELHKQGLAAEKRRRGLERLAATAKEYKATFTIPCAGPPAFLDPKLFLHNDIANSNDNSFPMMDTAVTFLESQNLKTFLAMPGDVLQVGDKSLSLVRRSMTPEEVYADRETYLTQYASRKNGAIKSRLEALPAEPSVAKLCEQEFARVLKSSRVFVPQIAARVHFQLLGVPDGNLLLDCSEGKEPAIRPYAGAAVHYRFTLDHRLVADLLKQPFINFETVLLSMRFSGWRNPDLFNNPLFAILVNFDDRRLRLAEQQFEHAQNKNADGFELLHQGTRYLIQRRCPHMGADLSMVGQIADGILTCARHGWQFRLPDGACTNVSASFLQVKPIETEECSAIPSHDHNVR